MKLLLSVIIPTYHRNDLLDACLDRLRGDNQQLDREVYEVIVSDDGNESTAQQMLADQYPWVRWVQGPQKGPAANRNNGAREARGKWLVFTDDDCLPNTNWLAAYAQAIQDYSDIHVFEGKTLADRPKERFAEESPINTTGGNLWSCNFAISRTVFSSINGFDEAFPYANMEDIDLHYRLQQAGHWPFFLPNALTIHPYRLIAPNKYQIAYKSFSYFLNKHNLINTAYRYGRLKHFIYNLYAKTWQFIKYKGHGVQPYLQEHLLNIKLILISRR